MALSTAGRNAACDGIAAVAGYASLHSASPGTTGANELSGGGYARQAITWSAAANGSRAISGTEDFPVPAGATVSHFGMWTAVTGGTFIAGDPLSDSEDFTAAGTYRLDSMTVSTPA
jgi:hypothetical protein